MKYTGINNRQTKNFEKPIDLKIKTALAWKQDSWDSGCCRSLITAVCKHGTDWLNMLVEKTGVAELLATMAEVTETWFKIRGFELGDDSCKNTKLEKCFSI